MIDVTLNIKDGIQIRRHIINDKILLNIRNYFIGEKLKEVTGFIFIDSPIITRLTDAENLYNAFIKRNN